MSNNSEPNLANKILGQIIQKKRKEMKLTQKQLAQRLGIPEQTLAGMESGNRPPQPVMRRALCNEFGIENLLSFDTDIDISLLNLIQESLELFYLDKEEFDFLINELKVAFGFDIEHIATIEDIFEKQRKKLKSISEERQKYIGMVKSYILDIIFSLYNMTCDKRILYDRFSYYLLHFYKQEYEYLVKFPIEYKILMNMEKMECKKNYIEIENKEEVIEKLRDNFKRYAQKNWFLDDKVNRFDFENNKEIYSDIRGRINGFYYNNFDEDKIKTVNSYKDKVKEMFKDRAEKCTKYRNNFKKFGTVYEFQILILNTLERVEKSYVLHNNSIPIHILPKLNVFDGYENLDIKWASDKYEYIAVKIDKSLANKYTYKENDVITIQIGNNHIVGDEMFIWNKESGFNIGELVQFDDEYVCIKNRLGEYKYKITDLKCVGIIVKNNKIYYKNIDNNLKKGM